LRHESASWRPFIICEVVPFRSNTVLEILSELQGLQYSPLSKGR
jgi:hypothetical protein